MRIGISSLVALALVATSASAQPEKVRLTTGKAVYTVGPAGSWVRIQLKNEGRQWVTLSGSAPWKVLQDGTVVFAPASTSGLDFVEPGGSRTWFWNKKNGTSRNYVAAGSYTIEMDPLAVGTTLVHRSRTIALTPTGSIAGSTRFPLLVGNRWIYRHTEGSIGGGQPLTAMTVESMASTIPWFRIQNFLGGSQWVLLHAATFPELLVVRRDNGAIGSLFRFGRAVGYEYSADFPPHLTGARLRVGAISETVTTPAGTFEGCYRLDIVDDDVNIWEGYRCKAFWFALGVGLVQYHEVNVAGHQWFRLREARIRGSDGGVYTIRGD